jgi:mannitol/fructose-specific phosphotransferase system IIA component (Ntr-type)
MRLAEILQCAIILDDEAVSRREQAIDVILDQMAAGGFLNGALLPTIRESIMRRDELGPTGIGEGVAMPHAWHDDIPNAVGALAISRLGLDYESFDRMPVHIVALLLSPSGVAGERVKTQAFETILRHLQDPSFRALLKQAETPRRLGELILGAG